MLNFGLTELWLVAPRCSIDHRAYALASHAGDVLRDARVVPSLEDALVGVTLVAGTSARDRAAENYRVVTPRELDRFWASTARSCSALRTTVSPTRS